MPTTTHTIAAHVNAVRHLLNAADALGIGVLHVSLGPLHINVEVGSRWGTDKLGDALGMDSDDTADDGRTHSRFDIHGDLFISIYGPRVDTDEVAA